VTEEQLINGCIKQDRRSQNELYKLYFPLMSSIALRYAPERDEALLYVNGGHYKVLKSLKTYDQKHTLATRRYELRKIISRLPLKFRLIFLEISNDSKRVMPPI
jgi:hypothetical protein